MRCSYKKLTMLVMVVIILWTCTFDLKRGRFSNLEKSMDLTSMPRRGNNTLSSDEYSKYVSNQKDHVIENLPWSVNRSRYLPNFYTRLKNDFGDQDYRDSTIVYLHHNKAAGSTTKKCLVSTATATKLKVGSILNSHGRSVVTQRKHADLLRADVFMGGYAFGICDHITAKPCSYFTILRDPYERLISSYSYCRRARHDQICSALGANKVSITEWAQHQGSFFFQQLLFDPLFCSTHFLSDPKLSSLRGVQHHINGRSGKLNSAACWFRQKVVMHNLLNDTQLEVLLNYCLENLEQWFSVIGLVEDYDTSLVLLEGVYNLPFTKCSNGIAINKNDYINLENQNHTNESANDTVARFKRQLQEDPRATEALKFDLKIYQRAKQIFEKQRKAYLHMFNT